MTNSKWIRSDLKASWLQKLCMKVLMTGHIPRHIAIIMDGNRRYAQRQQLKCNEGHVAGFESLTEILHWCNQLGVKECTVYAFSIENFKRGQEEIDGLMDLFREKYRALLEEKEKLQDLGIRVKVIGDISLAPTDIQQYIHEVEDMTKDNDKAFLNVAFCYTGREEICRAVKTVAARVESKQLQSSDVTEQLLESSLYCTRLPDLVVRTSGEHRLSDFLIWQSGFSCVYFTSVLWPEFSFWDLLAAVFFYQTQYTGIQAIRNKHDELLWKRNEPQNTAESTCC